VYHLTRVVVLSGLFLGFILLVIGLFATPTYAEVVDCDETPKDPLCEGIAEATKKYGGCKYNPYPILERYKTGRAVYLTPDGTGDSLERGIDPALACRLAEMLQALPNGCNPRINSAYRSAAHQQSICGAGRSGCAAPGRSCHQYGLAVDLTTDCGGWLRRAAPQFQLHFPYSGIHVQCIEHRGASVGSCNKPCNGGVAINPDLSGVQPPGAPTSGISNQFRNMLTPQQAPMAQQAPVQQQPLQQPQQPPLSGQNTTPQNPGTCAPQFYCTNNDLYYRASTCVDQLYQKCPAGCSGVACNVSPSLSTNLLSLSFSTTSSKDGTLLLGDEGRATTSIYDRILDVAGYTPRPADPPNTTPLVLIIDGDDAVRLQQTGDPRLETLDESQYDAQIPGSQQTFTSGDLSQSLPQQYPPRQLSTFQKTLSTMRETLLSVLAYLRPFGRPIPAETGETYYME